MLNKGVSLATGDWTDHQWRRDERCGTFIGSLILGLRFMVYNQWICKKILMIMLLAALLSWYADFGLAQWRLPFHLLLIGSPSFCHQWWSETRLLSVKVWDALWNWNTYNQVVITDWKQYWVTQADMADTFKFVWTLVFLFWLKLKNFLIALCIRWIG